MDYLPKAFLIPIDESEAYIRSLEFLSALYPQKDHLTLILNYIEPSLAPVYKGTPGTSSMREKKKNLLAERKERTRFILDSARRKLIEFGFPEDMVQEHVQEKQLSVAHHACRLADMKKVDAVVVPKQITSALEGFLKGNPTPELLHHCLVSPVWFVEGKPPTKKAVICVGTENASLRAVDHAGFMLAETNVHVDLVHVTSKVSRTIVSGVEEKTEELKRWEAESRNREAKTFLEESVRILIDAGLVPERIKMVLVPGKKVADVVLSYVKSSGAGIVVLGHSKPGGTWGFLKSSITEKIITSSRNMSIWVNQ